MVTFSAADCECARPISPGDQRYVGWRPSAVIDRSDNRLFGPRQRVPHLRGSEISPLPPHLRLSCESDKQQQRPSGGAAEEDRSGKEGVEWGPFKIKAELLKLNPVLIVCASVSSS